jgi:lipid-binding SYLF domain-containing protein
VHGIDSDLEADYYVFKSAEVNMRGVIPLALLASAALLWARDRAKTREPDIAQTLREIMEVPERAIPRDLLSRCRCVAVVSAGRLQYYTKTVGLGSGLVTCRAESDPGWSAPAVIWMTGLAKGKRASAGVLVGIYLTPLSLGRSRGPTKLILLGMTQRAADLVASRGFQLSVDALVAPGLVGRDALAQTPESRNADFLAWTWERGVVAGVSLQDVYVGQDLGERGLTHGTRKKERAVPTSEGDEFLSAVVKYLTVPASAPTPSPAAPVGDPIMKVVEEIRKSGPGARFAIPEIQPIQGQTCSGYRPVTFAAPQSITGDLTSVSEGLTAAGDGTVMRFATDFKFVEEQMSLGSAKVYLPRNIVGFAFQTQADGPLTFVLLEKHGLVHVGGRGQVVFPDGKVAEVPSQQVSREP